MPQKPLLVPLYNKIYSYTFKNKILLLKRKLTLPYIQLITTIVKEKFFSSYGCTYSTYICNPYIIFLLRKFSEHTHKNNIAIPEYEKFSSAINKSSMKLAFDILFYTGMRSGELLALTPVDILSSKRIDINKNYAKIKGEELFLEPKTPKAKRCISILDFLYNDIQEYISKLYGIGNGDRIFYFQKTALEKEMKRVSERVGLKPIRVHDLRHSHASMLIELGFTPLEIAERLCHESIKTTLDTYSHLYPDKDQKLADRLNQFRKN